MNKEDNKQRKLDVAQAMYLAGHTNKQISNDLIVTEKTVAAWIKKYKWEIIKAANDSIKPEIIANLYMNISEVQKVARDDERPLTASEADQIVKLSNSIARLQGKLNLQTYIEIFKEYNAFLSNTNPKLLKPNNNSQREFIQSKLNEYN